MKTKSIFFSAVALLVFIGCQSQKQPIKAQSEFQTQQNTFFKDASKSPLKSKDLKAFEGVCCRSAVEAYPKHPVF